MVGLSQDDDAVTAEVRGPDGPDRVTARYLVGCDGASSRVRDLASIPFPGNTYPEVQRLAQVTVPEGVTVLENGDIDVAGVGRISFGFTRTEHGEFALGSTNPGLIGLYTSEEEAVAYDDDEPMTVTELGDSIRRVLGVDILLGEPTRLTRFTFHAREVERYRDGRILMAGDAAHLFPSPGVALGAGLLDTVNLGWKLAADIQGWAPDGLLDTYHDERRLACARNMLHAQAQVAIRRGHDPAAIALRELFQELLADEQPLRRLGGLMAGSELRYPFPGYDHHALIGTFAPDLALRTDRGATSVAELMHGARPTFIDLADRRDLARDRSGLAASRRHPHRRDRSPTRRRPPDPPGRPRRVGRARSTNPSTPPRPRCGMRSPAGSARLRAEASFQPSSSSRRLPAIHRSFRTISGISPSSRSRCSSGSATARTSDVARTVAVRRCGSIRLISPTTWPGPSDATRSPSRRTSTVPVSSTKSMSGIPPCSISGSPSCSSTSTSQPASWPRS